MSKVRQHRRTLFFVTLTALTSWGVLGGCSNENPCEDAITVEFDEDTDFAAYETFAIREIDGGGTAGAGGAGGIDIPDDVRTNLEVANEAAATELELHGLERVDPDQEEPDLWLFSAASSEEESGVYWYCVPGYYWWGWYYAWDPCAWMAPIEVEYTVGSLLVGVADASEDPPVPVFGGIVQGVLECTAEDLDDRIEDSVADIFDYYPTSD